MALIELFRAPAGRYQNDVYLLPKKMGESSNFVLYGNPFHDQFLLPILRKGVFPVKIQIKCMEIFFFSRLIHGGEVFLGKKNKS